jgi:hypothetical protein
VNDEGLRHDRRSCNGGGTKDDLAHEVLACSEIGLGALQL